MICRYVAESTDRSKVPPAVARSGLIAAHQNLVANAPDLSLQALDSAVWNYHGPKGRKRR